MRQNILIIIFSIACFCANAQSSNPYEIFGHNSTVKYETPVTEMLYIKNVDTSSNIKAIAFDFENKSLLLLDRKDNIIEKSVLKPEHIFRWLSVDPLASKYPNESPYLFCGGSPIMHMDPDGREKIVVIGGGDVTANDKYKFVNSGIHQMLNYAKNNSKNEPITMLVTAKFIESNSMEYLQTWANATSINYGVPVNVVIANSGDEITNYLNSKNTGNSILTTNRTSDKLSSVSFFGHGYSHLYATQSGVGGFEPGHGSTGEPMGSPGTEHTKWAWGIQSVNSLNAGAFNTNSNVDFYSCNAATPNSSGVSLASALSLKLGSNTTVSGYFGRTDYSGIYDNIGIMGKLGKQLNGGLYPASNLPSAGNKSSGTGTGISEQQFFKSGVQVSP